jgi:hypothetical protein
MRIVSEFCEKIVSVIAPEYAVIGRVTKLVGIE